MAQVQTHREFKFVGGPSRKRRRNGSLAVPTSKQTKRDCPATLPALAASQPPLYHDSLPLPSPSAVASADGTTSVHPDIAETIAALSGSSDGHHTSSPENSSGTESIIGDRAATRGIDDILDWSSEFMNPFFSPATLDSDMLYGSGMLGCLPDAEPPSPAPAAEAPLLFMHNPPPTMPPLLSLPLPPHIMPSYSPPEDAEELPSHLGTTGVSASQPAYTAQLRPQPPSIPVDSLPMAASPRMYTQPSILYDTMSRMFLQYDQEFCILPLTCDFAANPFRYNMQAMQRSSLLRHCILALSYKHVDHDTAGACTSEAVAYKRLATQMLQDKMDAVAGAAGEPDATLLDASIVMMTLDCATSALGPWGMHLRRAKRLLVDTPAAKLRPRSTPSSSSPSPSKPAAPASSQRLAQLGLLAWFDVTLALTSRKGCIFPERTILSIFDPPEPEDTAAYLDFYAISGCPRELFECMVRLAACARELQITSTLSCVRFDMAPVLRIERRIAQWQSPAFDDPVKAQDLLDMVMRGKRPLHSRRESAESAEGGDDDHNEECEKLWRTRNIAVEGEDGGGSVLDYRMDLYHCAEAWRYALLIYIERVFKWQNRKWERQREREGSEAGDGDARKADSDSDDLLQFLARRTLNHITSCRRTTFVQKQLMLPAFLAGAETRDAGLRNDARDYCVWWGTKTRYNMFITARTLLEEVWRHRDRAKAKKGDDVWWGDIFDQNGKRGEKEYLLG